MTRDEIIQLAERVSSGLATEEEMALFNKAFNSFQSDPEEWNMQLLGNREEIVEMIHEGIVAKTKVGKLKSFNTRRWMVAATIVALLIAGAAYLFTNRQQPQRSPVMIAADKDIPAPAGNKAVITLGNGQQIFLDSNSHGILSQQGGVTISGKPGGEILYSGKDDQVSINSITVPRGSKPVSLSLADGTRVWVDAGSSLKFPTAFPGKERRVTVTGQAYFEVAQDSHKPFYVLNTSDASKVEVLGTAFNVNAYSIFEGTMVTLLNGAVNLRWQNEVQGLQPLQQAIVKSNGSIALRSNVDAEQVMSWKTGQFIFDGMTMRNIMQELERYYDVNVKFDNEIDEKFVMRISRDVPVSEVLKGLALTQLVHFKIDGRTITVSK
jgi:ferric-dicitrate binding protein FerR (iron transport regulator)